MTNKVVVYTKSNCPQCVVAKSKLAAAGIPYGEVSVDTDPSARSMIMGLGFRSVPVIFQGGEPVTLEALLQQ